MTLNEMMLSSVNDALIKKAKYSFEDMTIDLKFKEGLYAHRRYVVAFCLTRVCHIDKDDVIIYMNISLGSLNMMLRNFDMLILDKKFKKDAMSFINQFKNKFAMWKDKMSKEDRQRAIDAGLIEAEEKQEKPTKWQLVFEYCGSRQRICGPSNYKFCKFKFNQVKREPNYQRGELKIIPA